MRNLSDVDLHLYLAGALPPGKRFLMSWAIFVDAGLRGRLAALKAENAEYGNREMTVLRDRLFPFRRASVHAGSRAAAPRASRSPSFGLALAGSMAVLALCAVPFLGGGTGVDRFAAGSDAIPKGQSLGVTLYVKGDSAYRVEDHRATVDPADTLQALPVGTAAQHLVLLGWDARQGLVRLFPAEGKESRKVSAAEPPPALLLQGMEENRLICVTANAPFRIADAEAMLKGKPFHPLEKAPATKLHKGLYIQVFSIAKGRSGGPGRGGRI